MSTTRQAVVREVIKMAKINLRHHELVKIHDIIIININDVNNQDLDDSCWHLLRISTVDIILFLNETNTSEFNLQYPPVESTLRVRQQIDAVLNHETYPPKVVIKTSIDKATLSKDYFLQCNSRGNPLPRLLWSKTNDTLEYYPLSKQCKTSCRIYSVQHKYQSFLYFRSLTLDDIGIYICHAENPLNRTMATVDLTIGHQHQPNINHACSSLKFCHNHGQCIIFNNQTKCLCKEPYFGEQCETTYDDIKQKQDAAILLFKSRFLAGCILFSVGFLLVLIVFVSWFLARNNRQQRKKLEKKLLEKTSAEKPLIVPAKENKPSTGNNVTIPSLTTTEPITKPSTPPSPLPPSANVHISPPSILEKNPLIHSSIRPANVSTTLTREPSTATDDDDDDGDGLNSFLRHYQTLPPVPTTVNEDYEERFSLRMNKSEELGLGYLTNGTSTNEPAILHSYANFYQPDQQTGLIKPLDLRKDPPQRYTKYVSSYSKFVLPRPVKSSSLEYQQ
ncbi:unnamed protein product [Rotaria socialis]|uniref:EGF-like domain-containing protein n=2 Tax=Rotaria socialis TaxID=392032 RepID=A0A818UQR1_9BILA|nr:unnamed protein product [Rotaria socialis]